MPIKKIVETGVLHMQRVLFFGLGTMGSPISSNLLKAGLEVRTVPRPTTDPKKLEVFRQLGGRTFDSVTEAIQDVDIIFSMVTDDEALLSALLQDDVINHLNTASILIDMTSCSAKAIQTVAEAYAKKGVKTIDAPVSGGVPAAIAGTMTMICAGDHDAFETIAPVLKIIGSNIQYVGPEVGTGKKMKALNNLLGAIHKASTCEVFQIAQKAGLDLEMFGKIIAGSSGNSAQFALVYPRLLRQDYSPNFTVALMRKDVGLAIDLAKDMSLPVSNLVYDIYKRAAPYDQEDSAAIYKVYQNLSAKHEY